MGQKSKSKPENSKPKSDKQKSEKPKLAQPQKRPNIEITAVTTNDILSIHHQIQEKIMELQKMSPEDLMVKHFIDGDTKLPEGSFVFDLKYLFIHEKMNYKKETKFVLDKIKKGGPRPKKMNAINLCIAELIRSLSNKLVEDDSRFKFEYYCAIGRELGEQ